jgi:hemoglobin
MSETLYEHAGGDDGLHRLEEVFYAKALADPVLKQLFTHRVATHVDHLTWFTAESFGGPPRFTNELGFQYIIDVHRNLEISDEQRERFVAVYLEALDEVGMPDDEPFRRAVREHVQFGANVAQQNSRARTDAELHPIRAVPHWDWPD